MLEEIVRTEGVDVHVPTHADQLRSTEVIECEVILEQLGDLDDILWRGGFTGRSNFTEEFLEFLRADNAFCFQAGFGNGLLQELGHFDSDTEETPLLLVLRTTFENQLHSCDAETLSVITYSCEFAFKGRRQHVGEELQSDGKQDFHEGHDNKDRERNQS